MHCVVPMPLCHGLVAPSSCFLKSHQSFQYRVRVKSHTCKYCTTHKYNDISAVCKTPSIVDATMLCGTYTLQRSSDAWDLILMLSIFLEFPTSLIKEYFQLTVARQIWLSDNFKCLPCFKSTCTRSSHHQHHKINVFTSSYKFEVLWNMR